MKMCVVGWTRVTKWSRMTELPQFGDFLASGTAGNETVLVRSDFTKANIKESRQRYRDHEAHGAARKHHHKQHDTELAAPPI